MFLPKKRCLISPNQLRFLLKAVILYEYLYNYNDIIVSFPICLFPINISSIKTRIGHIIFYTYPFITCQIIPNNYWNVQKLYLIIICWISSFYQRISGLFINTIFWHTSRNILFLLMIITKHTQKRRLSRIIPHTI